MCVVKRNVKKQRNGGVVTHDVGNRFSAVELTGIRAILRKRRSTFENKDRIKGVGVRMRVMRIFWVLWLWLGW